MARRTAKYKAITRFTEQFDRINNLSARLMTLCFDVRKITVGAYTVYDPHNSVYYEQLLRALADRRFRRRTRTYIIEMWLRNFEKELDRIELFVTEQEAASMDGCQRARVRKGTGSGA